MASDREVMDNAQAAAYLGIHVQTLRRLNRWVAIAIGIGLLACAAFVLLDIVLRQVGGSFGGTDEISGYVMAIATSWGMAYTLLELGHVRIDLIRSRADVLEIIVSDHLSRAMQVVDHRIPCPPLGIVTLGQVNPYVLFLVQ